MDFNTECKIIKIEDCDKSDLIERLNEYLEERSNSIDSVHKIYYEELLRFLNGESDREE